MIYARHFADFMGAVTPLIMRFQRIDFLKKSMPCYVRSDQNLPFLVYVLV